MCLLYEYFKRTKKKKFRFLEKDHLKNENILGYHTHNNHNHFRAACHEFKCENNDLFVVIGEKSIKCDPRGDTLVPGFEGIVKCPDKELLCHEKFKCKYGCTEKYENKNNFFNYKK